MDGGFDVDFFVSWQILMWVAIVLLVVGIIILLVMLDNAADRLRKANEDSGYNLIIEKDTLRREKDAQIEQLRRDHVDAVEEIRDEHEQEQDEWDAEYDKLNAQFCQFRKLLHQHFPGVHDRIQLITDSPDLAPRYVLDGTTDERSPRGADILSPSDV